MEQIQQIRDELLVELKTLENPSDILKSPKIKELYKIIPTLPNEQKGEFGAKVNNLKNEIQAELSKILEEKENAEIEEIDISAPFAESSRDKIAEKPRLLSAKNGSKHPLQKELEKVVDIYTRMGFEAIESRQIDNDWNMFGALNFPENHPARDGYDTFRTEEDFIPPAHTSTMQNRVLNHGKKQLEEEGRIAHVSYGRVFRNEDLDATHEHTFYQCEGVFVSENAKFSTNAWHAPCFFRGILWSKIGNSNPARIFSFH